MAGLCSITNRHHYKTFVQSLARNSRVQNIPKEGKKEAGEAGEEKLMQCGSQETRHGELILTTQHAFMPRAIYKTKDRENETLTPVKEAYVVDKLLEIGE